MRKKAEIAPKPEQSSGKERKVTSGLYKGQS